MSSSFNPITVDLYRWNTRSAHAFLLMVTCKASFIWIESSRPFAFLDTR